MENSRIQTLSSDEDWNKWLPNLKLVARSKEVWDYIDPNQDLVLTEPEERWPDVEDPQFTNKIAIARIQYNREINHDIMEEVKQAKITALSNLYQQTADFLRAIRSISPKYYTQVTLEITRKEFTEQEHKENNARINRANKFHK
ncbi:hypothetical protein K456DRAFT_1726713 [Colletotrichum gloeosporioides 23]|nr:hypothetical protein K456DRAFT_1726713 [Colletotrichum gloeosporioides 23]